MTFQVSLRQRFAAGMPLRRVAVTEAMKPHALRLAAPMRSGNRFSHPITML
jgi:hypothetical protein